MIIQQSRAEYFLSNTDNDINFYKQKISTNNPCKIIWQIKWIELKDITWNVWPVYEINLNLNNNWKNYTVKSYWVTNFWDLRFEWQIPWLYIKTDWENYNPNIWDYILAKINPKNNYIIKLFKTEWISINDLNNKIKSINIPYCKYNETNNNLNYNNYYIFWWTIILILLIFVFLKTFKQRKKSV